MLEININFRLNNTAVTSSFHGQKVNKMHAIQHTVLRNFWPMALEKPTCGIPVSESIFIFLENVTAKLRNFKTNLSQPRREISVSIFVSNRKKSALKFTAETTSKTVLLYELYDSVYGLPRNLCS